MVLTKNASQNLFALVTCIPVFSISNCYHRHDMICPCLIRQFLLVLTGVMILQDFWDEGNDEDEDFPMSGSYSPGDVVCFDDFITVSAGYSLGSAVFEEFDNALAPREFCALSSSLMMRQAKAVQEVWPPVMCQTWPVAKSLLLE